MRDSQDRADHPEARRFGRDLVASGEYAFRSLQPLPVQLLPENRERVDQLLTNKKIPHPTGAEAWVPAWGSGREAMADYQDGDMLGATGNGLLAVSDVTGAGYVYKTSGKAAAKYAVKRTPHSWEWRAVRERLGEGGFAKSGQDVHHAFIAKSSKRFPEWIKNHPLNLTPMPSKSTHID